MGVVRIQAIGPGAVEYLLHGCDPQAEPGVGPELDAGQGLEGEGPELAAGQEPEAGRQAESGVGYFLEERGEPAGVWLGSGMESLGFTYRSGDTARENDLRAIFGELRYPGSQRPGSSKENPEYLRGKPRNYRTLAERVEAALKAEPDASPERQREIEVMTARNSRSNTAYYDVTFSPVKSVSVYYAALVAAGDVELAQQVRQAHDQAIRIAVESVQDQVAWAKTGRHGRASASGRTTGKWEKAQGLSAVLFAHHTNRDGEPQLHGHAAVLNVVATADERLYALDGAAFRPVKDAMAAAYDRAMEAILSDLTGVVWAERVDGLGREIAGIDPELMEEASTRSRLHVEPRIEELVEAYRERHGYEPGPQARRKIVDQAVKDTRRPKTGPAGPAAVKAWIEREDGRAERLTAALDEVDAAVTNAAANGHPEPMATGYVAGREVATGPELASGGQTAEPGGHGPLPAAPGGHPELAGGQPGLASADARALGAQGPEEGGLGATGEGRLRVAARERMGVRAVASGLERVQAKYPSWSIGALYREIDHALGSDAGAVGLGIDARRAWVWELAWGAVAPAPDGRVVQVSMGDPVPVPPEMRRELDGRSMLRAPIDERYVTAEHLTLEQRLVATAQAPAGPSLPAEVVGRVAEQARHAGLSGDQVDAVASILASARQVEVLVGPAGAGKSHTLAQLARAWQAEHGGRVIGTSTGEKATRNLAELGMQAANVRWLLTRLDPDDRGRVRMTLNANDLLVIDEAGMASTADLDALTRHAATVGAKVIWAGDHHQLPAIGAGGMFAHLAERPGAVELETVHRFHAEWERDASLRLRAGDASVASVYANEGRLRAGTLEQMEHFATRDYVADRLAGVSGLLIVGSNQRAEVLSRDIQEHLTKLGLVQDGDLLRLRDQNGVRMGDLIQAREGNATLRVVGPRDEHGRERPTLPVANRQVFIVAGFDADSGTIYARDEHGNVAHLPKEYVENHVTLAYAVTNHAAQGVTVDRSRALVERGMTAEALYPASTRGRDLNMLYLVTEIDPDPHAPQRERDTAVSALVRVLENDAGELNDAAVTVQDAATLEARSMLTLTEHYDRVATEQVHRRHAALAVAAFGPVIEDERAFGALLGRMRAVELEGHDIAAMFAQAQTMTGFNDARELSKVMHWRLGKLQDNRVPEYSREQVVDGQRTVRPAWEQLAEQHRERAQRTRNATEAYLATVADHAAARTAELGVEVAAAPPEWALEWLGPVPDADTAPVEHGQWVAGAGQVAAYREWRGIPEEQISIGSAPPPAQQLAHELWVRAAETGTGDPRVVDWRRADPAELRSAVRRWDLRQQWAPAPVSPERGEALALAHDAANDAAVGRAGLAVMAHDDPERARLIERVHGDEVMAEQAQAFATSLDQAHAIREAWWEASREVREAAHDAEAELDRRGLAHRLEPQPEQDQAAPEPDLGSLRPLEGERPDVAVDPEVGQQPTAGAGEQQALELDLKSTEREPQHIEPTKPTRHEQFLAQLAAEHQQALERVDPAGQMTPDAREAAVRAGNFEALIADLRREHGDRLDPEGRLDDFDLAHARAREVAEQRSTTAPAPGERTPAPDRTEHAPQQPDIEPEHAEPQNPPVPDLAPPPLGEAEPTVPGPNVAEPEPEPEPVVEPEPAAEEPAAGDAEHREPSAKTLAESEVDDGAARLRQVSREVRAARVEREVDAAYEARQNEQAREAAGPDLARPRGITAQFDREAVLDDELAAHREAARGRQAELDPTRERERGSSPEID